MNKTMLLPYLDRLDPGRQDIFHKLRAFADRFALAGGTAIMLQVGHRESYDFDCFSFEKLVPVQLFNKAKRVFGSSIRQQLQSEELSMITIPPHNIEVHFVWHPYPTLQPPIQTDALPLFHRDDLVTNKALTIGRRGAWRGDSRAAGGRSATHFCYSGECIY